ncbi:MAG: hypothetical protein LBP67_07230 [Bacteroidales bacterium]|jgi:nucleoid DNA-binding protein|nr:hypothetical protein [Bacteroidales bacterium]
MKVEKYISNLLYSVDCVVVVNLGGFILNAKDAIINEDLSVFKPPRKEVAFNSLLCNDDGVLISHISKKENISYEEAKKRVDNFVKSVKDKLDVFEPVYLPKLGLFQMNDDKSISFTAAVEVNYDADSFGLSNFILPTVNANAKNISKKETIKLSPRKIVKYAASVAAIFALGFILFTAADYGLQNLYQASIMPSKQKLPEITSSKPDSPKVEITENLTENNVEVETNIPLIEEKVVVEESNSTGDVFPTSTEETNPSEEIIDNITTATVKTLNVNSDFLIMNTGAPHPFVIVASCPDYECAKNAVLRFQKRGYPNAAIIHSGNRYRVTISSEMTIEELDATLKDAKENIIASAWVHYF